MRSDRPVVGNTTDACGPRCDHPRVSLRYAGDNTLEGVITMGEIRCEFTCPNTLEKTELAINSVLAAVFERHWRSH
ncbi:MAG: hypothetical protein PHI63_05925 [Patescibacteria group bacterium]|nr:hypothetical protein [Patescibacteria group bacterium]